MDRMSFERLCRDASLALGLDDTAGLGEGYTVLVDDVLFEFVFVEIQPSLLILAELGRIAPEQRLDVYESLLTLQLMTANQSAMRFGLNPTRQTAMLCVTAPLREQADGAWLASLMKSVAAQVAEWRTSLLAGKLHPPVGLEALFDEEPAPVMHKLQA